MNRNIGLLLLSGAIMAGVTGLSAEAGAQELSLRAGADVRPLIAFGGGFDGVSTIGDVGWLGITGALGLELVEVLTLEVGFTPLIPISGGPDFEFLITPGARLDLALIYARFGVPISPAGGDFFLEGAVGISLFQLMYVGALVDYFITFPGEGLFMIGAEVGVNFSLMEF